MGLWLLSFPADFILFIEKNALLTKNVYKTSAEPQRKASGRLFRKNLSLQIIIFSINFES
jgi:hypothetical protein